MSDSQEMIKASQLPVSDEIDEAAKDRDETSQHAVPLLPLKNVVMLPKSITPIIVGREVSIEAVEEALRANRELFITAQTSPNTEKPVLSDLFSVGIRATILQVVRMPNGSLKILAEGISRAKIIARSPQYTNFLMVNIEDAPLPKKQTTEMLAGWRHLYHLYEKYSRLNDRAPSDLPAPITASDMDGLVDTIAIHLQLSFSERQSLLECCKLSERIILVCSFIEREIEILHTEQRIRGRVQSQVEKNQKEYYLNEQIKAIHKELGREDIAAEAAQLRTKIKTLTLPKEVSQKVSQELSRLEQMPPMSPEATVAKNYIDWILALPWSKTTKDNIGIEQATKILDSSHAGLKKAKERILEFIAAKKFSKSLKRSPIICLIGPPGVGKTSLASSIAKSLGRSFVRISLGGVKDEAAIRGHRRTYIGSLPGKIIHSMRKVKVVNPVILLDEVDKMSHDFSGDPASALLEVLDPEQNKSFVDHFLDVEYDLSRVLFIATANSFEGIPYPLLDRMELITLSGYTDAEKMSIARQFLIPKNLKEYGLLARQCTFTDEVLETIILKYTKEAGVRQLDQTIAKLMRKAIQMLMRKNGQNSVSISHNRILEWLGHPKYKKTTLNSDSTRIGLATGLAWTELGGDVLEIETTILPGKGGMTLTGQLGEVMQESAQAALSYVRSVSERLKVPRNFHTNKDIHIHIPEGATPKDGPSAGIALCTTLISALTNTPLHPDVAMTGEVTLRGRVLSVGGLKEKLLAAKQHDMRLVLVPQENADDLRDICNEIDLGAMEVKTVAHMGQVIENAFVTSPFKRGKTL